MNRWKLGLSVVALLVASACGAPAEPEVPTPGGITPESTEGLEPGPVALDVTIIDGQVTPRGARVELKVGQPLTLTVHSDVASEIHVHTDPEQEFAVKVGGGQRFTFEVDEPGKVAVEVHDLDAVIAEVLVRK